MSDESGIGSWHGTVAALACALSAGTGLSISLPLLGILMERADIPATINGANTAVGAISTLLFSPFIARTIARFGIGATSVGAISLALFSLFGFWLTSPPWPWFPLRFLFGVATGILLLISEAWINAIVVDKQRSLLMGLHGTVLSIGFLMGPLVLLLTGTEGSAPFLATILLFSLGLVPIFLARDAIPRVNTDPHKPFIHFFLAAPIVTSAGLVFGAVESATHALLPVYGTRIGYDKNQAILLIAAMTLGAALFQAPLGYLGDRVNKYTLLFACGIISTLAIAPLAFHTPPVWLLYISLTVFGGSLFGLYTIGLAHLASLFRGTDQVAANAAFVMLHSIGMLMGPLTGGIGMDIQNPHGFIYVLITYLALFNIISGTYYFFLRKSRSFSHLA